MQPIASCGIKAGVSWNAGPSKSCWLAMLEPGAAFAHQGSPYVGPRPAEMGFPSHGVAGTAPAVVGTSVAAASATVNAIDTHVAERHFGGTATTTPPV